MKEQEKIATPLCNGEPLPTLPPKGASVNGHWACIDDEPVYIEDLGEQ